MHLMMLIGFVFMFAYTLYVDDSLLIISMIWFAAGTVVYELKG